MICELCSMEFQVKKHRSVGPEKAKYCSSACSYAAKKGKPRHGGRFVPQGDFTLWNRSPSSPLELFWTRVHVLASGCWEWRGTKTKSGYGAIFFGGRQWVAHRISFEACRGKIPDGLQLDHLCRNRICVNPGHLDPVTIRENVQRGMTGWTPGCSADKKRKQTHCKRGHLFDEQNTIVKFHKGVRNRQCLACRKMHQAAWYERFKAARRAS